MSRSDQEGRRYRAEAPESPPPLPAGAPPPLPAEPSCIFDAAEQEAAKRRRYSDERRVRLEKERQEKQRTKMLAASRGHQSDKRTASRGQQESGGSLLLRATLDTAGQAALLRDIRETAAPGSLFALLSNPTAADVSEAAAAMGMLEKPPPPGGAAATASSSSGSTPAPPLPKPWRWHFGRIRARARYSSSTRIRTRKPSAYYAPVPGRWVSTLMWRRSQKSCQRGVLAH